jgi:benzodiazapine receptor
MRNFLKLVFSIAICEAAGIVGAFFTGPSVSSVWYASLQKPWFQPPAWIFSPVWILLYALMGIALYLVWSHKSAMILFFAQLFFNGLWSVLFFGLRNPFYAFLDIVILWLLILVLVFKFFKIRKLAGWLLLPYLLWVSFAGILNYYLWVLMKYFIGL